MPISYKERSHDGLNSALSYRKVKRTTLGTSDKVQVGNFSSVGAVLSLPKVVSRTERKEGINPTIVVGLGIS